ncbi:hypothetical protein JXA85_02590 [Candidatus Woesearchaeota archaeon]|nr:hypothetical protein [Candidatus Woesearchaeota archaeon]
MNSQKIENKDLLINSEIAELLGVFIGDGWIERDKDALYITGSQTEDKDYYDYHLGPLFSKHFSKVTPKQFDYWGVYGIVTYKKEAINKAINLDFQVGRKSLVTKIPRYIMDAENKDIFKAILRGLFDTDGCFWCEKSRAKTSTKWKRTHNYHPELRITSCSKMLLEQVHCLLDRLDIDSKVIQKSRRGFKSGRNVHDSYALNIRKIEEIEKWFKIIGTNNPRHKTRCGVWKKLGYLPSNTTMEMRKKLLNVNR